jgi:hypothetical protein
MTITGSLAHTTDVVEKTIIVDMAENGTPKKATHTCMKTHFMRNRTEEVTVTTPALHAKNIHQDLLSRKACNRVGIRVILMQTLTSQESGLYLLDKDKQPHIEESIQFIQEPRRRRNRHLLQGVRPDPVARLQPVHGAGDISRSWTWDQIAT